MRVPVCLTLFWLLLQQHQSSAAICYLSSSTGVDVSPCTNVGSPCATFSFALAEAGAEFCDVINVFDGTYTGAGNRGLTLDPLPRQILAFNGTPIVDMQSAGRFAQSTASGAPAANESLAVRVRGITFQNGVAVPNGGVFRFTTNPASNATISIENCTFEDNRVKDAFGISQTRGGAIFVVRYPINITGSVFRRNWVDCLSPQDEVSFNVPRSCTGGAVFARNAISIYIADTLFEGNSVQNNATGPSQSFLFNSTDGAAGALAAGVGVVGGLGDVSLLRTTFRNNFVLIRATRDQAAATGGAMEVGRENSFIGVPMGLMADTVFESNRIIIDATGTAVTRLARGGALISATGSPNVEAEDLLLQGVSFFNNSVDCVGSDVNCSARSFGGALFSTRTNASFCTFCNNSAGRGAHVFVQNQSNENNFFTAGPGPVQFSCNNTPAIEPLEFECPTPNCFYYTPEVNPDTDICVPCSASLSNDCYVSVDGFDVFPCTDIANPCLTFQFTVDQSSPRCDRIFAFPGTFTGPDNRNLIDPLPREFLSLSGDNDVTVELGGVEPFIRAIQSELANVSLVMRMRGMTLRNGFRVRSGGALFITPFNLPPGTVVPGVVILENCAFENNRIAPQVGGPGNANRGGAADIAEFAVVLNNTRWTDNLVDCFAPQQTFVTSNECVGGALGVRRNGNLTILNSNFTRNVVRRNFTETLSNISSALGGAVFAQTGLATENRFAVIQNSRFEDNAVLVVDVPNILASGGAISITRDIATVGTGIMDAMADCTFSGNRVLIRNINPVLLHAGGAIAASTTFVNASIAPQEDLVLNGVNFFNNSVECLPGSTPDCETNSPQGGAVAAPRLNVSDCRFCNNSAIEGAHIYIFTSNQSSTFPSFLQAGPEPVVFTCNSTAAIVPTEFECASPPCFYPEPAVDPVTGICVQCVEPFVISPTPTATATTTPTSTTTTSPTTTTTATATTSPTITTTATATTSPTITTTATATGTYTAFSLLSLRAHAQQMNVKAVY